MYGKEIRTNGNPARKETSIFHLFVFLFKKIELSVNFRKQKFADSIYSKPISMAIYKRQMATLLCRRFPEKVFGSFWKVNFRRINSSP